MLIDLTARKSLKFWLGFERFENSESFGLFGEEREQKKERWRGLPSPGQTSYRECARRTRKVAAAVMVSEFVLLSGCRCSALGVTG